LHKHHFPQPSLDEMSVSGLNPYRRLGLLLSPQPSLDEMSVSGDYDAFFRQVRAYPQQSLDEMSVSGSAAASGVHNGSSLHARNSLSMR
jgi:hypothetical protein